MLLDKCYQAVEGLLLRNVAGDDFAELMILQAARARFSHTEYIACPSCGRTLYDIEKTLAEIKSRTYPSSGSSWTTGTATRLRRRRPRGCAIPSIWE